jgi:prepilin-type N-terminal cleavage/methylation domain-containing protein
MRRTSAGFTLIELMVVVAIVGVLSAVAVVAYNGYIRDAKMAKVTAHYQVAIDFVGFRYADARVEEALGRAGSLAIPATTAGWVALLDWEGKHAPDGGPPYVAGAGDASTGAIGVLATGTWATGDSQVTITLPAFADLTTQSVVLTMQL